MAKKVYTYNPNKLQDGGSAPVYGGNPTSKELKKYNIPTYDELMANYQGKKPDTLFVGYGNNKNIAMDQVSNNLRDARIAKAQGEGENSFNLPYLDQAFNLANFSNVQPKKGRGEDLQIYTEGYNTDQLQGGGSAPVDPWQAYLNSSQPNYDAYNTELTRADNVRNEAVNQSQILDKNDDFFREKYANLSSQFKKNPKSLSKEDNDWYTRVAAMYNAKDKPSLDIARKNLPEDVHNIMPQNQWGEVYNLGMAGDPNNPNFDVGKPDRELYCTPYGCSTYNQAIDEVGGEHKDVPTFGGNINFNEWVAGGKSPFEVTDTPLPGDMASLWANTVSDYQNPNAGDSYRPHHTGIVSEVGQKDEYGNLIEGAPYYDSYNGETGTYNEDPSGTGGTPFMSMYNAGGGKRGNWNNTDQSLKKEDPRFFRYVGESTRMGDDLIKNLGDNIQYAPTDIQDAYNAEGANQMDLFNNIYNTDASDLNNTNLTAPYGDTDPFSVAPVAPVGMPSRASMITGESLPIENQYQMGGMLSDISVEDLTGHSEWTTSSGMGLPGLGTSGASQISRSPRYFKKGGTVPQMQGGGLTPIQEWWQRQTLGGGNAGMRQDHRLQGLQARSGVNASTMVNPTSGTATLAPTTGQQGIQQQRLANRATKLGVDLNEVQTNAGGAALTNKQMKTEIKTARQGKNAEFAGKVAPIAQGVSSMGSALIAAGDTSGGEDVDVGSATAMGALKMGAQGAAAGATFGPYGAAIGAAIGTTVGAITGNAGAKKLQKKIKVNKEHRVAGALASGKQQNEVQAASVLSQYPTQGVDNVSYFAENGGLIPNMDYQVEGGEVMMAPPNNPPKTDKHGNVHQIGRNMFKFEGDTHDSNSGGIGVQGGNTEFASQTNQVLESGFVFSDRIKPSKPEDYLYNV